jgi:hypothetical protein
MKPWLIYALGGGWGHLNRAIALGRVAARQHPVHVLTNSPYAAWVRVQLQRLSHASTAYPLHLQVLPITSEPQAVGQVVQDMLQQTNPACLIVDTFPRGLGGELADILPRLKVPRILVHRDLQPHYIQAKEVLPWVQQHYDRILMPGEAYPVPFRSLPQVYPTAPWLVLSADELPELQQVRSRWHLPSTATPVIMVCAGGNPSELAFFGRLSVQVQQAFPAATLRCLAYECPPSCPSERWIRHWPGLEILQVADVVIGAAGYNTVYECAALQRPLIAFAFDRLYDRQALRAQHCANPVDTIEAAIAALHQLSPVAAAPRQYDNGVHQAIALIEDLCLA